MTPTADSVLPGSVRSVYSNVQGDSNVSVSWQANGGSLVDSIGYTTWTAPQTPGVYTVTATSVVDNTQNAIATFTVIGDAVLKVSNIPMQVTAFKNQPIDIQSIIWGSTNTAVSWTNSGGTLFGNGREVVFSSSVAGTYTVTAASVADNSKTATTTIVVTDNEWPAVATPNKTQPIDCTPTGSGSTYDVTSEAEMDLVPWSTLGAGDTVRIHAGVVYHKQILISTSGTDSQPIRVCGVPDLAGNLPELNGVNATAKAGSNYGSAPYAIQTYGGIVIYDASAPYWGGAVYPKNIIIEGLKITGYHPTNSCHDLSVGGALTPYVNGAAPVRIQHGGNITIRGNDFQNSGNGFFVMSNVSVESKTTRNLLVEGNYFFDNGVTTYEHQSYIQAFGLVVQGNYYDHSKIGVEGSQLKTRSVQQFIRYNYLEPAGRVFDLVEIQDSPGLVFPWIGIQANELTNTSASDVVSNYESYQNRYVYGNIVHNITANTAVYKTSASVIHVSADNDQTYQPGGSVYFYNNTLWLSLVSGQTSNWRNTIIDGGPYGTAINSHTVFPHSEITNNAIYIAQPSPASGMAFFWNSRQADRVMLGKNWISAGWGTGNLVGGDGTGIRNTAGDNPLAVWQGGQLSTQVSGIGNLLTGASMPFDSSTYVPINASPLINSASALTGLATTLPPLMQYSPTSYLMSVRDNVQDIGAISYAGVDATAPRAPSGLFVL